MKVVKMLKKFSLSIAAIGFAASSVLFPSHADSSVGDKSEDPIAAAAASSLISSQLVAPPREVKTVMVMADGRGQVVSTSAKTVQQILEELKVKLSPTDLVSPSRDTVLTGNQLVTVTRMSMKSEKKNTVIPFKKVVADSEVDCGDTGEKTKVTTTGVNGTRTEVWSIVTVEGKKPVRSKASSTITRKPVDEVTSKCVKYETVTNTVELPVEDSSTSSNTVSTSTTNSGTTSSDSSSSTISQSSSTNSSSTSSSSSKSSSNVTVTGTKADWMRAAGIPESDWQYVDYIVTRESSWNYKAVNPSSGAYGLPQSLPASKMASAGSDWRTNPVTQLKWQKKYVYERYDGSYQKAFEFWKINHWY